MSTALVSPQVRVLRNTRRWNRHGPRRWGTRRGRRAAPRHGAQRRLSAVIPPVFALVIKVAENMRAPAVAGSCGERSLLEDGALAWARSAQDDGHTRRDSAHTACPGPRCAPATLAVCGQDQTLCPSNWRSRDRYNMPGPEWRRALPADPACPVSAPLRRYRPVADLLQSQQGCETDRCCEPPAMKAVTM